MNGGAEVNGVGGGLETSPNSTGCGRLGGGGGSPEAQAQSGPQSRSLLLFVALSPPPLPPKHTRTRALKVFSAQRKMATD